MWASKKKSDADAAAAAAPPASPDLDDLDSPLARRAGTPAPDPTPVPEASSDIAAPARRALAASDATTQEPAATASIVETVDLRKTYGTDEFAVHALDGVSLAVAPGEFVAVMGPSGCGKSTLLNMLGGLDSPTAGRVVIDGDELTGLPDDKLTALRRRKIGFIFQAFNLIPVLDAVENAALPLTLDGASDAETRATTWLQRVGLGERLRNRPDQLSGGQQQRVAVARALSTDPALVLADEPTGNLDSKSATEIAELLRQVATEWHRSVLMVTHDPRIASFAGRLVLMSDGRIVDDRPLDGSRDAPVRAMEEAGLV